jgi:RHH-type transcriptional regulator, proline utilization regulon repressor / proline dehydrogenase / delta 1-pyrroline-5-carboxylate dehydrogenase
LVSAPGLGPGGRGFESPLPDQSLTPRFLTILISVGDSSIERTDRTVDRLGLETISTTRAMIDAATRLRSRTDRANQKRIARLFDDPTALDVTVTLTDQVMRVASKQRGSALLREASRKARVAGFGAVNTAGLKSIGALSRVLPSLVLNAVHWRVRELSKGLILNAEPKALRSHLRDRSAEALALNVNVLGEAVLGEGEANARLGQVLEMMSRPEVTYLSVKVSSIVSQLSNSDPVGSRERILPKLRTLYSEAQDHGVFVNLDMEEFRDLRLTLDVFFTILSEPAFLTMPAGIVLQAYLPETHDAFDELAEFARTRVAAGGAKLKIRIVKGANLAMETTEAAMHGWVAAPYGSKSDTDASYLRLVDLALRPENADFLRVGVASHNLFHLNFAIALAKARGVESAMDLEMLEGMANAEALLLAKTGQHVLLYAPVTRPEDFGAAVAYLVRRLDENTSPENYLRAAFTIDRDPVVFDDQRERFVRALEERHTISTNSRRHVPAPLVTESFENASSLDSTAPGVLNGYHSEIETLRTSGVLDIPLVINGEHINTTDLVTGVDPSNNNEQWYRYRVANNSIVDQAISAAQDGALEWSQKSAHERASILRAAAQRLMDEAPRALAVMSLDAGKTFVEGEAELCEASDFCSYYASMATDDNLSAPMGVVAVIPPWNFPYAITCGGVSAALAAGNSVILKPAPETVATAWLLVNQLWASGVPTSALHFLPTRDDETGQRLITHDGVNAVVLTGAFSTAELFTNWKNDLHLLAETSGKNAILVSACADIDLAVKDLVSSAFSHAGQKCSAASLAIVERGAMDDPLFVRQLVDATESLTVGRGWDSSTVVGPLIHAPEGNLKRAFTNLDDGESWLLEPKQLDEAGNIWRPGIKIGVQPGSWSHQNEWFGPVLGIMVTPDFATALRWQNATPYGLTAGLHSMDEDECSWWIEHIEAGNAYVNRGITGAVVRRQPFGGWKRSSVGPTAKAGGPNYVNSLRAWAPLSDVQSALAEVKEWWTSSGTQAIDPSQLGVERNLFRFRRTPKPIVVRCDQSITPAWIHFLEQLHAVCGLDIALSSESPVATSLRQKQETVSALSARHNEYQKLRWLSGERAPHANLLAAGISIDARPLAQRGNVEAPRWFLEQAVAITNHRYGNANAGPRPICEGLR